MRHHFATRPVVSWLSPDQRCKLCLGKCGWQLAVFFPLVHDIKDDVIAQRARLRESVFSAALDCVVLYCVVLCCIVLYCIVCIVLHCMYCIALYVLYCIALYCIALYVLYCIALHRISPHLTTPHRTSPHLTAPHRTSPHLFRRARGQSSCCGCLTPTRCGLATSSGDKATLVAPVG